VFYVGASGKKEFLEAIKLHIEQMIKEYDK
jgi:hypothetical protein